MALKIKTCRSREIWLLTITSNFRKRFKSSKIAFRGPNLSANRNKSSKSPTKNRRKSLYRLHKAK